MGFYNAFDKDDTVPHEDLDRLARWATEPPADEEVYEEVYEDAPVDRWAFTPNHERHSLADNHLGETIAKDVLRFEFRRCPALGGWLRYTAGRWAPVDEYVVRERIRHDLIDRYADLSKTTSIESDKLRPLLAGGKPDAMLKVAKGILVEEPTAFDAHPDLLCVANGVVDLRTGQLLDHDPDLLLTKSSPVAYHAGATSPDWSAALEALPKDVADWMQVRFGQAATGHATPDDVMPLLQGSGANGKSTVVGAITAALGEHATVISERVLLANPSDHPTELTDLKGARLALIEETPEARHLNVKRLKDVVGTATITARKVHCNNMSWTATHSLFLTSNYRPRVDETDHGTWRRLSLVRFPYTFVDPDEPLTRPTDRVGSPGLRERLRAGLHGQHEAVLAWIVEGAKRWYAADRVMPPAPAIVKADTLDWRSDADLVCGYLSERLVFDAERHVMTTDLLADFNTWAADRGHKPWSDQTLTTRFQTHHLVEAGHVEKRRVTFTAEALSRAPESLSGYGAPAAKPRYMAWLGVRFRTDADDLEEVSQSV